MLSNLELIYPAGKQKKNLPRMYEILDWKQPLTSANRSRDAPPIIPLVFATTMSLQDDLASSSQFLSPRKTLSSRRSKTPLLTDGSGAGRGASLAHELAAALMPEPSASSRLLADEFGIEFDEGAEGIDEEVVKGAEEDAPADVTVTFGDHGDLENEITLAGQAKDEWEPNGNGLGFMERPTSIPQVEPERANTVHLDPLTVLNQDVQTTDAFIEHLRRLDADPSSSSTYQTSLYEPPLERLATDFIRRINDSTREREGQVRELREVEKEFKKIAGQAGGMELLGELDELEKAEEEEKEKESRHVRKASVGLHTLQEEEELLERDDWELDPNRVLGDEDGLDYNDPYRPESPSPVKESSSLPPPPSSSSPTPANSIVHLGYMRTITQSLITSLTTVVENTQVTGATTADAGRKIRALKTKLGGWRAESESAERSMEKIEKWEAAGGINSLLVTANGVASGTHGKERKLKQIMQEELMAFEGVLAEAGRKTQAIMAAS